MTTEIDPCSRIKVLDTPILAPGICCLCGSSGGDGRKFIDFGKQLDWYGAVYFCSICIQETAQAIGFIPADNFDKLYEAHRREQIEKDKLEQSYKSVENALRNVLGGSRVYPTDAIDIAGSSVSAVEQSESVVGNNGSSTDGDTETEQSSGVEGFDDLFDDSSYDDSEDNSNPK